MKIKKMSSLDLAGKRVLIREDLNVPVKDGVVTSDARIRAALPTIEAALTAKAHVLVMSHLGRPEEGKYAEEFSLAPVAKRLTQLLGVPVALKRDWLDGVSVGAGEVVLLENVRFNKGEKKDSDELAKKMAALCDIYVMDAFGTAHRAEASTHAVAKYAPVACAGPLLASELSALETALEKPDRPLLAIVAGSKVSTKLTVLETLLAKVDQLIVGGGITNTFLAALGYNVGKSLHEPDMLDICKRLLAQAKKRGIVIPMPTDVVVATEFSAKAEADVKPVDKVLPNEMILDVGPDSAEEMAKLVATLGPATDDERVLTDMVRAGVDVVRLNFSHGAAADHARRLDLVRTAAARAGRYVGVLGDLAGPKIRIDRFKAGKVELADGAGFALVAGLA